MVACKLCATLVGGSVDSTQVSRKARRVPKSVQVIARSAQKPADRLIRLAVGGLALISGRGVESAQKVRALSARNLQQATLRTTGIAERKRAEMLHAFCALSRW
jgi:hypothetical protein